MTVKAYLIEVKFVHGQKFQTRCLTEEPDVQVPKRPRADVEVVGAGQVRVFPFVMLKNRQSNLYSIQKDVNANLSLRSLKSKGTIIHT